MNKIEYLKYKKNKLIDLFIDYNRCHNSKYTTFEVKEKKDLFNLTFTPGLNSSSLTIQNSGYNSRDTDFGNELGFRFGVETEFILPFNKSKWAITIEPTFQYFKSEKTVETNNVVGGKLITHADYKSIEIPISLRHYFFLNNKSKIFVNASIILDFNSNSSIAFMRADGSSLSTLEIAARNNLGIGVGYKLNDRYSMELRFHTKREVLSDYSYWSSDYKTLSIIFGYSIF